MSVMVRFFLVKSFRKGQLDRQSALQGLNLILDFDFTSHCRTSSWWTGPGTGSSSSTQCSTLNTAQLTHRFPFF